MTIKMRKRGLGVTVITALLLCMTACSQDETLTADNRQATPLSFTVSTDDYGTRGTPRNFVSGAIGVLGYEFDEWVSGETTPDFLYNIAVQGSGTEWKTVAAVVPDREKTFRFYAYYPYQKDVSSDDGMIKMSPVTFGNVPYFDYTSPATADEQQDLMYAVSNDVQVNEDGHLDPVELRFHHLLSAVKFTITNGFDNGTITRVSLKGIRYQGRFNFRNSTWTSIDEDTKTNVSQTVNVKMTTKNTDRLPLTSGTQYFMLVPQTLPNACQLELVYNNGDRDFTLTYDIGKGVQVADGAGGTTTRKLTFEQGKITTLNLGVESVTKMTVVCTVDDWGHGANFDGTESDQSQLPLKYEVDDWESTGSNGESTEYNHTTGPQ